MPRPSLQTLALFALALVGAPLAYWAMSGTRPPTLEEYLAHEGLDRTAVVTAGLEIEGRPQTCADRPTVLNPRLDDVASAFPDFIVVNPKAFEKVPPIVRLYAHAHECGHVRLGASEEAADCYAMFRGKGQGWLTTQGVREICDFWGDRAGSGPHAPGPERCALMQRCFASAR